MVLVWTDDIHIEVGQSLNDKMEMDNPKRVIVKWVDPDGNELSAYKGVAVLNSTNPTDFHRPHKMVTIEVHVSGRNWHQLYHNGATNKAYIIPNGNNLAIPYFVVRYKDAEGHVWEATFVGVVPCDPGGDWVVDGETVTVYAFVGKYYNEVQVS